jgi:hypothetical protein
MKLQNAIKSIFLLIILFSFSANAQLGGGFGLPGIDPDHIPKNPFEKDYNRVSKCELRTAQKIYQLNEPPTDLQAVLEVISLTRTGKKLVDEFLKQEQQTPHKFIMLNTYVRQQNNFPTKIGAVYMFNEHGRSIYYDPQDDLGLLAVMISHEFTHAIDAEVPPAYFAEVDAFKNKSKEEFIKLHQANSFRLERRAFDMQDKILSELLQLTDCYGTYLDEHRKTNGLKLFLPTPDSFIREAYGLPENLAPGLHIHD